MILHVACKIMGKLKQLLPQAAPSLCQNTTESLRGKGKIAVVKAAKIVRWLLCGRLQPGLSNDSNHCGMVLVLFLLFSHFEGEEGVSGGSDASLELGWSTFRYLPCQWLPCVYWSHPSAFCPSFSKEDCVSIPLRCEVNTCEEFSYSMRESRIRPWSGLVCITFYCRQWTAKGILQSTVCSWLFNAEQCLTWAA